MNPMLAGQRRLKILELLQEEGSARVRELSSIFQVTEPTIRHDLEELEAEGLIIKHHGGAFLKSVPRQVRSLSLQHDENMELKRCIAERAADFIDDGDSIILDSGSTISELAKLIQSKQDLKIVTNALNIALLLGSEYGFEVMMTGGEFKPPTLSLTGGKAAEFFHEIHVNKLFLATGGISPEGNLTYPGLNDLPVKRAMIDSSDIIYLLADSTKIGKAAFAKLGSISMVDVLITDSNISGESAELIGKFDVQLVTV